VWFDAHGDLNTPESSPSHAFGGMVLRTLLGDGHEALVPEHALDPARVVLAGARSIDQAEADFIAERRIRHITADEVSPETLVAAVEATGASSLYLHLDLDVLDPADIAGLSVPEPFGVTATTLVETVRALVTRFKLAGAGITQFAPSTPTAAVDDAPTILRLIGALSTR
jgi:arginase